MIYLHQCTTSDTQVFTLLKKRPMSLDALLQALPYYSKAAIIEALCRLNGDGVIVQTVPNGVYTLTMKKD